MLPSKINVWAFCCASALGLLFRSPADLLGHSLRLHLDALGPNLGALGSLLGPTWRLLGSTWTLLGASWAQLGLSGAPLELNLAAFQYFWASVGPNWAPSGLQMALQTVLQRRQAPLGPRKLASKRHLDSTWAPSSTTCPPQMHALRCPALPAGLCILTSKLAVVSQLHLQCSSVCAKLHLNCQSGCKFILYSCVYQLHVAV